ncbi:MAG: hypothetical protein UT42_C0016G0008 [Candidatus Falkowbacteria bacterium GW2011_GWA2_39_24]|uniref:Uncharacterized protein n=1 Tax=Candidatus Falkowbacteria bacterium GW2011_GWA2_39_24 TaxID=1618634 RepID=A0A0G0NFE3_9BACT|nr:MAG: hypothetical protein UT42_C0016G0008 [Candidatus Falkowbacteria bacterium GW2011_GWA2_39_24]
MPSPILTKKQSEGSLSITTGAKKIFQAIYREQHKPALDDEVAKIKVSELISKMAFYYEKIRNSVDYKEEYLMRKGAILRILKRQVVIESSLTGQKQEDPHKIATVLLVELIRAGYLANNKLPESLIDEVAVILERYLVLKDRSLQHIVASRKFFNKEIKKIQNEMDAKTELTSWIMGMAASEIEEHLSYDQSLEVVVGYMYQVLNDYIALPGDLPYDEDLSIQVYLGIYRNFLQLDDEDVLSYILLKYYYPTWGQIKLSEVETIAERINRLRQLIYHQIHHPLKPQLNKIVHRHTVYFSILQDVIKENPQKVFEEIKTDPKSFDRKIKQACANRYRSAKKKLWHSAARSIIYIFLTKSVFAVLLEVPATKFFGEEINAFSLGINIAFPALLLFIAVSFTRLPGANNTEQIIKGIHEIMFIEKVRQQPIILRRPPQRSPVISFIFSVIYIVTFFVSFGLVLWVLEVLRFSWVSMIIFLFFLVFAAFFAVRIRRAPKSLVVVESRENIFSFLWNFFYIPVISVGKWLSGKFARINVFVFILDFIIEAPFKIFVAVAEEWTKYVKERKDELS